MWPLFGFVCGQITQRLSGKHSFGPGSDFFFDMAHCIMASPAWLLDCIRMLPLFLHPASIDDKHDIINCNGRFRDVCGQNDLGDSFRRPPEKGSKGLMIVFQHNLQGVQR